MLCASGGNKCLSLKKKKEIQEEEDFYPHASFPFETCGCEGATVIVQLS